MFVQKLCGFCCLVPFCVDFLLFSTFLSAKMRRNPGFLIFFGVFYKMFIIFYCFYIVFA